MSNDIETERKLLACPFCGGNNLNSEACIVSGETIFCNDCTAEGPARNNIKDAANAWNTRIALAVPQGDENQEYLRGFNDGQEKVDIIRQRWNAAESRAALDAPPPPVLSDEEIMDVYNNLDGKKITFEQPQDKRRKCLNLAFARALLPKAKT